MRHVWSLSKTVHGGCCPWRDRVLVAGRCSCDAGAMAAAVLGVIACLSPAAAAATPVPSVTGPLPATAASYPFGAADHQMVPQDLRRDGYVEEEYFLSGTANVYGPTATPRSTRSATMRWRARATRRRTSSITPPLRTTSSRP